MILLLFSIFHQTTHAQTDQINLWMSSVALIETGPAFCSAVSLDSKTLATAYHCISSTETIHVRWEDKRKSKAYVKYADPKRDLAIIELTIPVERDYYPVIANKNPVRGENVVSMGHPYAPYANRPKMEGTLLWSASTGIISQVGTTFLQTDAALNPGNSGGPSFNEKGEIIGIASRKLDGDNLSFLAPASALQLLQEKQVKPNWWGGSWGISLSNFVPFTTELQSSYFIETTAHIRKYIALQTSLGRPFTIQKDKSHVFSTNSLLFTKGIGHGSTYSSIGIGAGISVLSTMQTAPNVQFQFAFGGSTIGYHVLFIDQVPILGMHVALNYPGTIGVF